MESIIESWLHTSFPSLSLLGSSKPLSLIPFLSQAYNLHKNLPPQLVLLAKDEDVEQFSKNLLFFDPEIKSYTFSSFDVGFYSNLSPSMKNRGERMHWLYRARQAKPGDIFITSLSALMQKTLPLKDFKKRVYEFSLNDELPSNFLDLLKDLGYQESPLVEDMGSFSGRGGLIDVYSPSHLEPIRIELFGNKIESIRTFHLESQRSLSQLKKFSLIPTGEALLTKENCEKALASLSSPSSSLKKNSLPDDVIYALKKGFPFQGFDFYLPLFHSNLDSPLSYFPSSLILWILDSTKLRDESNKMHEELNSQSKNMPSITLSHQPFFNSFDSLKKLPVFSSFRKVFVSKINLLEERDLAQDFSSFKDREPTGKAFTEVKQKEKVKEVKYNSSEILSFQKAFKNMSLNEVTGYIKKRIWDWKSEDYKIFISFSAFNRGERIAFLLKKADFKPQFVKKEEFLWSQWIEEQREDEETLHLLPRFLSESLLLREEKLIFLRDKDFFSSHLIDSHSHSVNSHLKGSHLKDASLKASRGEALLKDSFPPPRERTFKKSALPLLLEDLNEKDLVVHRIHGVGQFEGLQAIIIGGLRSEFLKIKYRNEDKLYIPVTRIALIQKFSSLTSSTKILDKLGENLWEKRKSKVKKQLRELASELISFYAKRLQMKRPPFPLLSEDFVQFEREFPYQETKDQRKAIQDVLDDMTKKKIPMDRLICGDVGFGKTEVSMRATFKAVESQKQIAVIVPTTILSFQHYQSFSERFRNWPISIKTLNRFISKKEKERTLLGLKNGEVDVVIGTHRLLSQDVEFKNLGLLVIDEEQRFGVRHKEKIRQMKTHVDTLLMSATPIPRTLNLSLSGLKDISLILTPPQGRLPIRTFICKFNHEIIKNAIQNEIQRGGQILFIHNRIRSLPPLVSDLEKLLPQVRVALAHGQMKEGELEKVMVSFFNRSIDLLVCTTIIESGMDIPRANTLFIDKAHNFGLSELYQLRGRVGRSTERAYCYLFLPSGGRVIPKEAEERLKTLREFSHLGSGLQIAQKDLELRGGGNILGAEQSGHINAVGYHLYVELLEEAIEAQKLKNTGLNSKVLDLDEEFEPEIHLHIEALIPESYIPDIRFRLAYYRELSHVRSLEDINLIEEELYDRFGPLPKPLFHLMDLMWIRKECRDLKIKDLKLMKGKLSLLLKESTPLSTEKIVLLAKEKGEKYFLRPNNRFLIYLHSHSHKALSEKKKKEEEDSSLREIKEELAFLKELSMTRDSIE